MPDPADVIFCITSGHAPHAAATLRSLLAANPGSCFRVTIFCDGLSAADQSRLRTVARSDGGSAEITFRMAARAEVDFLPLSHHGHWMTYFKLLAIDSMAAVTGRLLYLDADLIVSGVCRQLVELDLGGAAFAAVPDAACHDMASLGLRETDNYVNAGVLLVDTAAFARAGLARQALRFAQDRPEAVQWWDQCALNAVSSGQVRILPARWNMQSDSVAAIPAEQRQSARAQSRIVHFTGSMKPWHYRCEHPWRDLYWDALQATPWRGLRPSGRSVRAVVGKTIKGPMVKTVSAWRSSLGIEGLRLQRPLAGAAIGGTASARDAVG